MAGHVFHIFPTLFAALRAQVPAYQFRLRFFARAAPVDFAPVALVRVHAVSDSPAPPSREQRPSGERGERTLGSFAQ